MADPERPGIELPDPRSTDVDKISRPGIKGELQQALATNQYEVAKEALGKTDGLLAWRRAEHSSSFSQFYELFESVSALNTPSVSDTARSEMVNQLVGRARSMSPRVRELYLGLLSEIDKTPYTSNPDFKGITERRIESLKVTEDLDLLVDPSVPWDVKLNRMQTRIESELKGRAALDRIDERKKEKDEPRDMPQQDTPPPESEESKPGMDEMERLKEGEEAAAIWTIDPANGGYFREMSFDTWDQDRNTWVSSGNRREEVFLPKPNPDPDVTISAFISAGEWTRLPTPYLFEPVARGSNHLILVKNKDGGFSVTSPGAGNQLIEVGLKKTEQDHLNHNPPEGKLTMQANLSQETEDFLEKLRTDPSKTTLQKARSLASFTMRRLQYSNDSSYNTLYENHSDGYIGAIDQFTKADCDVANTYFAALCAKLDIPARHVVGHMVKGKNADGNSAITSGTGHAWTEVWDDQKSKWIRIDATPPGDPQQDEQEGGENIPGDYGEQEAIRPTDEELQKLREQLAELTKSLSYTKEEREMSEAAGVELKDARQIIKEIKEADEARLPNGERVVDVMASVWDLIRESRTIKSSEYTGPVRKREGGEGISNIVAHAIGVKAGDIDPASRERMKDEEFEEQIIRMMKVLAVFDGSGSMGQTVDGETKLLMQRKAGYLAFASLYRAEQNNKKARMTEPLGLESQALFFRGASTIDNVKPLSDTFTLLEKVKFWKGMGTLGGVNGDVASLELYRDQIKAEQEELAAAGLPDNILRIILICSDGMPDDPAAVQSLAEEVATMNTVVVPIGITETASQVPIIFNTPNCKGDIAKDINDLPAIFAKHVVGEAIKLFPQQTRGQYQKSIDAILAKFDRVGVR